MNVSPWFMPIVSNSKGLDSSLNSIIFIIFINTLRALYNLFLIISISFIPSSSQINPPSFLSQPIIFYLSNPPVLFCLPKFCACVVFHCSMVELPQAILRGKKKDSASPSNWQFLCISWWYFLFSFPAHTRIWSAWDFCRFSTCCCNCCVFICAAALLCPDVSL